MIICFIRHGETSWNRQRRRQGRRDVPLNSTGRRQMHRCGHFLSPFHPDVLLTSPLSRARDSAAIIADHVHFKRELIESDPDLLERDFGDVDGMTEAQLAAYRAGGGSERTEPLGAVYERMNACLTRLCARENTRLVFIVSHSAAIKTVFVRLTNRQKLQYIPTRNAGVSIVQYENGVITPVAFNLDPAEARKTLFRLLEPKDVDPGNTSSAETTENTNGRKELSL